MYVDTRVLACASKKSAGEGGARRDDGEGGAKGKEVAARRAALRGFARLRHPRGTRADGVTLL